MKIYRTIDNNYVTIVAHDLDLEDADDDAGYEYFGAFEYSIAQNEDTGEWILSIFDLGAEEILDVDSLLGVDGEAVSELVKASRGEAEFEEITGSDYYERIARFRRVLEDEVLMRAIAAEYAEKVED